MTLRWAIVGVVAVIAASPAAAIKARQSPNTPAPAKVAAAVNLENKRPVSLLRFEIVMQGVDKTPETIVGKLEKPLGSGQSASFPLTGATGCLFQARWAFEDINDVGDVDLCNDAHIVLVD